MKPTAQVKKNINEQSIDARYQVLHHRYHQDPVSGNAGDLAMLLCANEEYTTQWQNRFIHILGDQHRLTDIEWDEFYQTHVDALYYYQRVNQTDGMILVMLTMKLKALEMAYQEIAKKRYFAILSSQKNLTDAGLQRLCSKFLADNHPDRYQGASQEIINRQAMRFQVLNDILKELRDPNLQYERAKVSDLKQWFLNRAEAADTASNMSIQFAARFVREGGLSSYVSQNVIFDDTEVAMSTQALVPTVTPEQRAQRKHEQTLKNAAELLLKDSDSSYLTKQAFEADEVHPLIWNVVLSNTELVQRQPGGVELVFQLFIKHQLKEKIPRSPIPTYPWIIKAFLWTTAHCRCPIDDLAEKKSQYTLNDEERLFLSLISLNLSRNFHMEYYENIAEEGTQKIISSLEEGLNTALLNDLALRDLAWEMIVDELRLYRAGTSYYKDLAAFINQLDFIYAGVRRGALSLNLLYHHLIVPLKQLILDLEKKISPEMAVAQEEDEVILVPLLSDQITLNRIEQLNSVLEDIRVVIHQEIRQLVAMPRIDPSTKEYPEQERNHQKFIDQLYEKIVSKIEQHASSKNIGKHRNTVGPAIKAAVGVMTGVALTSTVVGAFAWGSKIFRLSFGQTFFDTDTKKRLKECEKQIIRDQAMIQRVPDIGPVLREDDYFAPSGP